MFSFQSVEHRTLFNSKFKGWYVMIYIRHDYIRIGKFGEDADEEFAPIRGMLDALSPDWSGISHGNDTTITAPFRSKDSCDEFVSWMTMRYG